MQIRMQASLGNTLFGISSKIRIIIDKDPVPIRMDHHERYGNAHHIALTVAKRERDASLGGNVAVARAINHDLR